MKVFSCPSEPIPIPAPSVSASVATVVAIPTTKSPKEILSESTINSVPSTYKLPLILTLPLVAPTPDGCGSIMKFSGPCSVADVDIPFIIETPVPTVLSLIESSK